MQKADNKSDGGWEQFKKISEYTKRNLMGELMPIIVSHQNIFENLNLTDFTWPDGYNLQYPKFLDDPVYGGGVFPNPDGGSDEVNYQVISAPWELISFYAKLSANMLAGSTAAKYEHTIDEYEHSEHYRYDFEVPNGGVSALMCFVFSSSGVSGITLMGPDPDQIGESKDYTKILRNQKKDEGGWVYNGTMRNDWYTHEIAPKEYRTNITTLTIINPEPGTWSLYAKGWDDNRSLHTFAAMVNGAKVNISFNQGNGIKDKDGEHPVTDGDFAVQVIDDNGEPLPEKFYDNHFLKTQCDVLRIPPWLPISEDDVDGLMKNFTSWLEQTLSDFKEPETWLTQMSGGQIEFQTDVYNGSPALMGHFKAPLPGLYYVTLTMTVGEGDKQIDYSKSFWVTYEAKTNRSVTINKADRDGHLTPPYLPEGWWKTSNTSEAEDLVLRIEEKTLRIKDSELAEQPYIDPSNPQTIVIHSLKAGKTELSFDVTTEYGDRWHLTYPVIIRG